MDSQESPLVHHPLPFLLPPPSPPVHRPPPFLLPPSPTSPLQPHQTSPPAHNPPSFLRRPPPPSSPPPFLLPPPAQPQSHQQELPNSYILPTNAIFQQPHQQDNLQLPFNSVSGGQNPKANFVDHSDGSSVAAAGVEVGAKKKRGRPRKYHVDGNNGLGLSPTPIAQIPVNHADFGVAAAAAGVNGAASSQNPAKKGRGRPPGSGKKQKREASGAAGSGFTPHFIHVHIGEDIVHKVMAFSLQGPPATCVLSATGVVCNVTLRQTTMGGGTVTYEGRFNIISLTGSFLLSESNGNHSRTGSLSVSLCGPDGGVLGGVVDGVLKAASPVLLVMGSFIPPKKKPMLPEAPSSTPPPNMSNVGAPVTEASAASLGASGNSANENGGSPLSHERGPFGNAAQPTQSMPTYWGQAM